MFWLQEKKKTLLGPFRITWSGGWKVTQKTHGKLVRGNGDSRAVRNQGWSCLLFSLFFHIGTYLPLCSLLSSCVWSVSFTHMWGPVEQSQVYKSQGLQLTGPAAMVPFFLQETHFWLNSVHWLFLLGSDDHTGHCNNLLRGEYLGSCDL